VTADGKSYIDAKIEYFEDEIERLRAFRDNTAIYVEKSRDFLDIEVKKKIENFGSRIDVLENLEIARSARYGAYGAIGGVVATQLWELVKKLYLGM